MDKPIVEAVMSLLLSSAVMDPSNGHNSWVDQILTVEIPSPLLTMDPSTSRVLPEEISMGKTIVEYMMSLLLSLD